MKQPNTSGLGLIVTALPLERFLVCILLLFTIRTQADTLAQAWVQRYHGAGSNSDIANAIAVDKSGNVFVTGYSSIINGTTEFATVAYSSTGVPLWTNRYNEIAPGSRAQANAIALDNGGNVVVTGSAGGGPQDYATVKYSGAGVPLWTNRYNGPGNGSELASAIAVDTNGNVFVTGYSPGINIFGDYATIAYSSEGVALWTNRYSGPVNGDDGATAMAVDTNGDVFVTGFSAKTTMTANAAAFATIKYSGAGLPLWTNRFGLGAILTDERPSGMVVNGAGNVFVTGYTPGGGARDYATVAYSSAGVPLWTNRFSGPGDDLTRAITADGGGNVFVTGSSSNGTNTDYLTIAYSSAGTPMWTNRYNGSGNGSDVATAMAMHSNGNVFVTGRSSDGTDSDYVTIAYSNSGIPFSINRYDVGNGNQANAIAVDMNGNVFVTGRSISASGYGEFATLKYSITVPLAIEMLGNQLVLSWTNAAFELQTAPAVTGTFTNVSVATSPYTNSITGDQQFFRLISN